MTTSKKIQELILAKLDSIEKEVKQVRTTDIPNLKVEVAVIKTESKSAAKLITSIGAIVAITVSTVVAFFK